MRFLVLLALTLLAVPALAVPPGYRYVGSRVVSSGRVVYWYWNADHVEIGPGGASFVAHMYARAAEVNQERPYVAIVRCDSRTYRDVASRGAEEPIDEDEPIHAVWRAGCDNGIALKAAARAIKLGDTAAASATESPVIVAQAQPRPAPAPAEPADPRRADTCVRFADEERAGGRRDDHQHVCVSGRGHALLQGRRKRCLRLPCGCPRQVWRQPWTGHIARAAGIP